MRQYISQNHIWDKNGMSFYAKGIYCLLAKFVNSEGKCWPSLKKLTDLSGLSKPTVLKALVELRRSGSIFIERQKTVCGDFDHNTYCLPKLSRGVVKEIDNVVNDIDNVVKEIDQGGKGDLPGVVNDVDTNLSNITNTENYIKDTIPFAEIIGHLNSVCGTSFKATTKSTQSHIKARWREGHRLNDFKAVINSKAQEWLNNPEMSKYLRPETLFGTKFESYLQANKPAVVPPPPNQIQLDPQALEKYSNQLRKVNNNV